MEASCLLPKDVRPTHYHLTLRPNLEKFTFDGVAVIDLKVLSNTRDLVFHSCDLAFQKVSVTDATGVTMDFGAAPACPGATFPLVEHDEEAQTATLHFGDVLLLAGAAKLYIEFTGILNDKMVGFYRSIYKDKDGKDKPMATTQFEAIDARRAFPCWDEPAAKATFDVVLEVPSHLVALSNMPAAQKDILGSITRITYERTPVMSTYLVAFVVGALERVTKKTPEGVEVNVWTTPGKKDQGRFALQCACRTLSFFNNYFNLPYPLPKADLVAIPDFASGAMENWGLITFRETALLVDEVNTSAAIRQRVAYVVAHELAHQWFGNLVTMEWWNDLWLNEGFATWVGTLGVAHLFPEWDMWTQFTSADMGYALDKDSLLSSHPIEVDITDPKMIGQVFDALSYQKGACVIRMLEAAVGAESFKKGLHQYLKKHKYGNTRTQDLWSAIGKSSGMDVAGMMNTWTAKIGFPLLSLSDAGGGVGWELEQHRFVASGPPSKEDDTHLWHLPVSGLCGNEAGAVGRAGEVGTLKRVRKAVISEGDLRMPAGGWVKLNAGQTALCRVNYEVGMWKKLAGAVASGALPTVDRLGLVSDAFALARAGVLKTSTVLDLTMAYRGEGEYTVWNVINGGFSDVNTLLQGTPEHERLCRAGRILFKDIGAQVGWVSKEGEGHLAALLRTLVVGALNQYGDLEAIAESKRLFALLTGDRAEEVSPDLRGTVMATAIRHGGREEWGAVKALHNQHTSAEQQLKCLSAMGATRDPAIVTQYLEWVMKSGDVRMNNSLYAFAALSSNPVAKDIAWDWVKEHFDFLYDKFNEAHNLFAYILTLPLRGFASHAAADDVESFFREHPVDSAKMAINQALEAMRARATWYERDGADLRAWLEKNA